MATYEQYTRSGLTPELAVHNPEAFKSAAIEHMGTTTELGALAWNVALDSGTLRLDRLTLDPRTWASSSRANGELILGTAAMSPQEKEHYLYLGERMSYADEVGRRFLHEINHGGYYRAQNKPVTRTLVEGAAAMRRQSGRGMSTLGSHAHYRTPADGAIEDVVELITMRMVGAEHFAGYADIMTNPRYESLRNELGLVTFEDKDLLMELVDGATEEALSL